MSLSYCAKQGAYLEVVPNQGTSWAQGPTILRGLGHVPENFEFLGVFSGVAIWSWTNRVTFINIVKIALILFSPYVLLFPKLFTLSLSEQHYNLISRVSYFAITVDKSTRFVFSMLETSCTYLSFQKF